MAKSKTRKAPIKVEPPKSKGSLFNTVVQWLFVLAAIAIALFGKQLTFPVMPGYQVVLFALALAFTWVEILKWGVTKPFNCMKCMTGWLAFILAFCFHTPLYIMYLFIGLFVGAMWEAVKMRWL